uniref:Transposase n=1 Tax=Heterorhabditis bacteriophora TaxID=37862 RepID=A0A1I7WQI3_HETBA
MFNSQFGLQTVYTDRNDMESIAAKGVKTERRCGLRHARDPIRDDGGPNGRERGLLRKTEERELDI